MFILRALNRLLIWFGFRLVRVHVVKSVSSVSVTVSK